MAKTAPYQDPANGSRWTMDVDADDEVNYVGNVTKWLTDNGTTAASFVPVVRNVTVLLQGPPQGPSNGLLPVKLKVNFTDTGETYCTFRVTTADGQRFDRTVWFKKVEN